MRLGVFMLTYLLANFSIEDALTAIAKSGFRLVNYVTLRAGDMRYLNAEALRSVVRLFRELQLEPCQFIALLPGNPASADERKVQEHMEYWHQTIRFAKDLGYKNVLTFPGEFEMGTPRNLSWEKAVERLQEKCREAEDLGIILSLEPSPRVFQIGNSTELVGRLIKDVGASNLTATVDTGHMCVLREGPEQIHHIQDVVVHVHLSDNDGTLDSNDALGTGICDISGYLGALRDVGMEDNAKAKGVPVAACIEIGDSQRYNQLSADSLIDSARRYISTLDSRLTI